MKPNTYIIALTVVAWVFMIMAWTGVPAIPEVETIQDLAIFVLKKLLLIGAIMLCAGALVIRALSGPRSN